MGICMSKRKNTLINRYFQEKNYKEKWLRDCELCYWLLLRKKFLLFLHSNVFYLSHTLFLHFSLSE